MDSAVKAEEKGLTTSLIPAEQMRELTISKEDLRKKKKNQVLDNIFTSMVKVATENGHNGYGADFAPDTDESFLKDIEEEIKTLGYKTDIRIIKHPAANNQEIKRLVIDWGSSALP